MGRLNDRLSRRFPRLGRLDRVLGLLVGAVISGALVARLISAFGAPRALVVLCWLVLTAAFAWAGLGIWQSDLDE